MRSRLSHASGVSSTPQRPNYCTQVLSYPPTSLCQTHARSHPACLATQLALDPLVDERMHTFHWCMAMVFSMLCPAGAGALLPRTREGRCLAAQHYVSFVVLVMVPWVVMASQQVRVVSGGQEARGSGVKRGHQRKRKGTAHRAAAPSAERAPSRTHTPNHFTTPPPLCHAPRCGTHTALAAGVAAST